MYRTARHPLDYQLAGGLVGSVLHDNICISKRSKLQVERTRKCFARNS